MGMYGYIATLTAGITLNIFCLITFIKSNIYQSPTGLTLTSLAVTDNIVLVSTFFLENQDWSMYMGIPSLVTKHTFMS